MFHTSFHTSTQLHLDFSQTLMENFGHENNNRPGQIIYFENNSNTVRVAYYEHLFIMNQAEGPNRYILMHLY